MHQNKGFFIENFKIVGYLAIGIQDHKNNSKLLFPDKKFKPKYHFVELYPDLVREVGPLVSLWTMRFEANTVISNQLCLIHIVLKISNDSCSETPATHGSIYLFQIISHLT